MPALLEHKRNSSKSYRPSSAGVSLADKIQILAFSKPAHIAKIRHSRIRSKLTDRYYASDEMTFRLRTELSWRQPAIDSKKAFNKLAGAPTNLLLEKLRPSRTSRISVKHSCAKNGIRYYLSQRQISLIYRHCLTCVARIFTVKDQLRHKWHRMSKSGIFV